MSQNIDNHIERLSATAVSDEAQIIRAATVLSHTHAQVAPIPPYNTNQNGLSHKAVGWSGNGGKQTTLTAGNAMRITVAPWSSSAPVIGRVLPVGTHYPSLTSTTYAGTPITSELIDNSVVGSAWQAGYVNINQADSGFPQVFGTEPIAQLSGGHMTVTVVCAENSSASVVAIGQNEVRGVGVGAYTEDSLHMSQTGLTSCLPDFANAELTEKLFGSLNEFKEPEMIVGTTNLSTKVFSIPIKPSHGNWYEMQDGPINSYWIHHVSAILGAERGGGLSTYIDSNDKTRSGDSLMSIIAPGTYAFDKNPAANFISQGNPFFTVGGENITGLGPAPGYEVSSGSRPKVFDPAVWTQIDVLANPPAGSGLVSIVDSANAADGPNTAVDESRQLVIAPTHGITAQTLARARRIRAYPNLGASAFDGMPVIEIVGLTGTVQIQVHFKLHYQVAVTVSSPHYERAITALPLDIKPFLDHVSTHAGAGQTVEEAVHNSLMSTLNQSKRPRITNALTQAAASVTGGTLSHVSPPAGVKESLHHDDHSHTSFVSKLLGGVKSGFSFLGTGAKWAWQHKGDILSAARGAYSGAQAVQRLGGESPLLIGGGALYGALEGGQPPMMRASYADAARRAITNGKRTRIDNTYVEEIDRD